MAGHKLPPPSQSTGILAHLLVVLKESNRTRVKQQLREGLFHVNGESVTRHDHVVGPDDILELRADRAPAQRALPFPVLFEDSHLLVIEKPCGLLTIATPREKEKTVYAIVNRALAKTRERVFVVHRLDRFTSGVLVLAKSEDDKGRVMGNWEAARKTYHAVVEGTPVPTTRTLVHYLREDERLVVHALDVPARNTERAVLTYRVLGSARGLALLEIDLGTGRKNQIRAQLAAIGHPIVGDAKYGAKSDPIRRMCLHASRLSIPHPTSGERLEWGSPMPKAMSDLVPRG